MIIGKLIPAGTGMKRYRNVVLSTDYKLNDVIDFGEDEELLEGGEVVEEIEEAVDEVDAKIEAALSDDDDDSEA